MAEQEKYALDPGASESAGFSGEEIVKHQKGS